MVAVSANLHNGTHIWASGQIGEAPCGKIIRGLGSPEYVGYYTVSITAPDGKKQLHYAHLSPQEDPEAREKMKLLVLALAQMLNNGMPPENARSFIELAVRTARDGLEGVRSLCLEAPETEK